jgi:hypothetical protein
MTATLFRVVNQQTINRSILLDKIDRSQGNFEGYARRAKQKLYVPYSNPLDSSVKGYVDLVPTDEVLLHTGPKGVITKMVAAGKVTLTAFNSSLTATPTVTAAAHSAAAPIGGQTGSAATIATAVSGKATITGLTGMTTNSVGRDLVITGGAIAANNGTFRITDYVSATSVKISNSAATSVGETNNGSIGWTEQSEALTTVTGTTFLSLAPDISYVTLTNLGGSSQIITDAAIIAAGPPSAFGNTSIVIQDALVTIGTPTTGWTVKVQANSKQSNTFTLT